MTSHEIIADFVFESLPGATVARRIEVSRAMAALSATPGERKNWMAHVHALEAIETDLRQMRFHFQRSSK